AYLIRRKRQVDCGRFRHDPERARYRQVVTNHLLQELGNVAADARYRSVTAKGQWRGSGKQTGRRFVRDSSRVADQRPVDPTTDRAGQFVAQERISSN